MKKWLWNLLIALSAVVLVAAVAGILYRNRQNSVSAGNFVNLSEQLDALEAEAQEQVRASAGPQLDGATSMPGKTEGTQAPGQTAGEEPDATAAPQASPAGVIPAPGGQAQVEPSPRPLPDTDDPRLLAYRMMAAQHPDMVGWLSVEGTVINYPVMRSPEEPERYLHADFNGQYSRAGTPFMLPSSDPSIPSGNLTIYAHHMKDHSMFGALSKYEDVRGFKGQPFVQFDSLYERGTYVIMAAFRSSIGERNEFKYYNYADFQSEEEFDAFVETAKHKSLYKTGIDAQYGDQLLTLSTCDYHEKEGRLVVVAKRIDPADMESVKTSIAEN